MDVNLIINLSQIPPCQQGSNITFTVNGVPYTGGPFPVPVTTELVIDWTDDTNNNCCVGLLTTTYIDPVTGSPVNVSVDTGPVTIYATNTDGYGNHIVDIQYELCEEELPCVPRWRDRETLTAKANCICSRFQVELIEIDPEVWIRVVLDTCTPADPMDTMFGFPFQEITVVINPDYLLSIMECICATGITSEYVIPW